MPPLIAPSLSITEPATSPTFRVVWLMSKPWQYSPCSECRKLNLLAAKILVEAARSPPINFCYGKLQDHLVFQIVTGNGSKLGTCCPPARCSYFLIELDVQTQSNRILHPDRHHSGPQLEFRFHAHLGGIGLDGREARPEKACGNQNFRPTQKRGRARWRSGSK